jgi:outer membrane protein assembly factor BamB
MNKLFFLTAALCFSMGANAEDEMPEVRSTKFDDQIDWYGCDDSGNMAYGMVASDKEISVYESATGKLKWTKSFKELATRMRKIDDIILINLALKIFLLDLKIGSEQVAVVDLITGNLDWDSDKYKLKSRDMISYISEENAFLFTFKDVNVLVEALTGEEHWSTQKFKGKIGTYYYDSGMLTTVNFVQEELLALLTGFKNQIAKINMKTGEIMWENTYVGRAHRKILTKEFMYDLNVVNDKVVLELDGLQMYDYKTGAQLWSAAFDYERVFAQATKCKHIWCVWRGSATRVYRHTCVCNRYVGKEQSIH